MSSTQITLTCRCAAAVLAGCLLVVGCGSAGSGLASPAAASARTARAATATTSLVSNPGQGQVIGFFPTGPI
jgi:hypothetical protein